MDEQARTKKLAEICKEVLQGTEADQIGDVTNICKWISKNAMQDPELEVLLDFIAEFILTGTTMLKRARVESKVGRRNDADFIDQLIKIHEESIDKILAVKRRVTSENNHRYKLAFDLELWLYRYNMQSIKSVQNIDSKEILDKITELCGTVRETRFNQSSYVVLHNYMCEYEMQLIRAKENLSSMSDLKNRVAKEFPDFSLLRLPGSTRLRTVLRRFGNIIDVIVDKNYSKAAKKAAELAPDGTLSASLQNKCFESLAYIELTTAPISHNVYDNFIKTFDLYTKYLHVESANLKPAEIEKVLSAFRCVGALVVKIFEEKAIASKKRGQTHFLDEYYSEIILVNYYFCEEIMVKQFQGEKAWNSLKNALDLALQIDLNEIQQEDMIKITKKWHNWYIEKSAEIDLHSFKEKFQREMPTKGAAQKNEKFHQEILQIFGFETGVDEQP